MNRSTHPFSNFLIYRNVVLGASIAGAAVWIGQVHVVSAQQINPFAIPPSSVADVNASGALQPLARARLQMPDVGGEHAPALAANLAANQQAAIPDQAFSRVGPDWSSFTPAAFADTPSTSAATAHANTLATRPSRLPATGESAFSAGENFSLAPLPEVPANVPAPPTRLASAAKKRAQFLAQTPPAEPTATTVYLTSQTAQSQIDEAAKLFRQASLEYDCAAFASAETSAWAALEKTAQAIDLAAASAGHSAATAPGRRSAVQRLHLGRRAITEAQDFVGPFAHSDRLAIARLARAHQTSVVRESLPPMTASYSAAARLRLGTASPATLSLDELPSSNEAIDRYLDFARTNLATIAAESLLAAQAMDLLAAIRLGRGKSAQLPGPTSICLRRAAVQGQSSNPDLAAKLGHQLADIGLLDEARWALAHSLSLQYHPEHAARLASLTDAREQTPAYQDGHSILAATGQHVGTNPLPNRVPEITNISPQQFAAISHSVIPGSPRAQPALQNPHSNSADGQSHDASETTPSPAAPASHSLFQAMTASFRTPASDPPIETKPEGRATSRLLPGMKKWW